MKSDNKFKSIKVSISECLSTTVEIIVPKDLDEFTDLSLEQVVKDQVVLPSETILEHSSDHWYVDDFCISI